MNKLVLFAAVVSLGAQASASFELMYIPVVSENRVARYDPVNRILLGGFNAPGARRVMAGNEQLGVIRVSPGAYRFNMFNGMQSGYIPIFLDNASYNRHNATVGFGSAISYSEVVVSTGNVTGTNLAGVAVGSAMGANRFSTGQIGILKNDAGTLRASFHSSTGALISLGSTSTITTNGLLSNSIQWVNRSGAEIITTAFFDSGAGAFRLAHLSRSSTGAFGNLVSGSLVTNFASTQPVSLAPAHNGFYVVGADATNPGTLTRIWQYDNDDFGFNYDSWTVNLNVSGNSSFGVGMVIAPEPGTMIALGAGVVALLRRRKRG